MIRQNLFIAETKRGAFRNDKALFENNKYFLSIGQERKRQRERKRKEKKYVTTVRDTAVCLYFEILFRNDFRDASFFYLIQFMYLKYLIMYVK